MTKAKRALQAVALSALTLLPAVARAGVVVAQGLGLPPDASQDGHKIDGLIHETLIFIGIMFAIMVAWMVTACLIHGRKHRAEYAHTTPRGQKLLVAIVGVLVLADAELYLKSLFDMNDTFWNFEAADQAKDVVRIEVNAHQWAWQARYAGPDGRFNTADDIVTLNDFRVPQGAPVLIQLTSTDVIHSFYLPNFRVKQDAMPGMVNRLWFKPMETGEYEIGCAQHCGVNHYKMRALLTVLPKEAYDRWAAEASANSARGFDADDVVAHWGWDWKDPKPVEGDVPRAAEQAPKSQNGKEG